MNTDPFLIKATAYCAHSEHCESEVRLKLSQWGLKDECEQNRIIAYLFQEHYLDCARYCKAFVNDKIKYQGWGKRKIRQMLIMKNLPRQDIAKALTETDEQLYQTTIERVLSQKYKTLSPDDPHRQDKLYRFALSRGFSYEDIEFFLAG